MRRIATALFIGASVACGSFAWAEADHAAASHDAPAQADVKPQSDAPPTPDEALERLVEGNKRFINDESTHDHADEARRCLTTTGGQHPFAAILSCADSRVPVEIIFDQGIGDLFVIRVAGNVADTDEIGTIEYGVGHLNIPLIVVIGHTKCGAVTAVVDGAKPGGSLPGLLDNIIPAAAKAKAENPHAEKTKLVNAAIRANVYQSISDLLSHSEEVREAVKAGKVKVIGGVYDIHNGTMNLIGGHPSEALLLAQTEPPVELMATEAEPKKPTAHGHAAHAEPAPAVMKHAIDAPKHDTHAPAAEKGIASHEAEEPDHDKPAAAPKKSKAHAEPKTGHDEHDAAPEGESDKHAKAEHDAPEDEHAEATTQPATAGGSANNWMMLGLCLAVSGGGSAAMITLVNRTKKPAVHATHDAHESQPSSEAPKSVDAAAKPDGAAH